jgi:hypothetical protein
VDGGLDDVREQTVGQLVAVDAGVEDCWERAQVELVRETCRKHVRSAQLVPAL